MRALSAFLHLPKPVNEKENEYVHTQRDESDITIQNSSNIREHLSIPTSTI